MKYIKLDNVNILDDKKSLMTDKLNLLLNNNITKIKENVVPKYSSEKSVNLSEINISNKPFYVKTLPLSNLGEDYMREINNMRSINSNRKIKKHILHCKYLLHTNDAVVSIFEKINETMLLRDFLNNLASYDNNSRDIIIRHLIICLMKSLHILHQENISHTQLSLDNILINSNPLYDKDDLYSNEEAFIIKYINFNLSHNRLKKKYISNDKVANMVDPYMKEKVMLSLADCINYDIWCLGLIILKLIVKQDKYYDYISNLSINNDANVDIEKLLPNDILRSDKYKKFYSNLKRYIFTKPEDRQSMMFILNKIFLDEKHN